MLIKASTETTETFAKIKYLKPVAFVDVIGLSRVKMETQQEMLRPNLHTCRVKPAEQNLAKLYDSIGVAPLSLPDLFCSTLLYSFVTGKLLGDFLLRGL